MTAKAGLSYYGINCYSYHPGDYKKRMDAYADKPLVFTEWAGGLAQGNARVLGDLAAAFVRATRPSSPRRIAGHAFWAWADYEEYNRPGPCAIAGWTREGLIDEQRRAKPDLAALSQMCFEIDHPAPPPRPVAERVCRCRRARATGGPSISRPSRSIRRPKRRWRSGGPRTAASRR